MTSVNVSNNFQPESKQENDNHILKSEIKTSTLPAISMNSNMASKFNHTTRNTNEENDITHGCSTTSDKFSSCKSEKKRKDSGSRATTKQVFPNIPCLPTEESLIFCFILSVWDNIVGPQTVNVWKRNPKLKMVQSNRSGVTHSNNIKSYTSPSLSDASSTDRLSSSSKKTTCQLKLRNDANNFTLDFSSRRRLCLSSVVKYVTEHTVNVGDSRRQMAKKLVSFCLFVPHHEIIVVSVRFYIIEDGVGVPYCLSAVIPEQDGPLPPSILNLCSDAMYRISARLRLLISKDGLESGDGVREDLMELCATLTSIGKASLSRFPLNTLAKSPDDRSFAEKVLTSHLQTMGASLVIADSPSEANKVVMWLGQFLPADDKIISRIAFSDELWPFQPGLSVQAVIRDSNGSIDLSSSKLLSSNRPLTLIDLGSSSVRQMALVNVHARNSEHAFQMELLALWQDLDRVPAPSQGLFESVDLAAPMVKRFLHEWDRLASCEAEVKNSYLSTFYRSIQYTALSIITWFKHEWKGRGKFEGSSKCPLRAISSTFSIEENDLRILLSEAEKLKPGFISDMLDKNK